MKMLAAYVLGVATMLAVTNYPPVAIKYSQYIYDCGIRIASNVKGGTMSNFYVTGHDIGLCIDRDSFDTHVTNFHFD